MSLVLKNGSIVNVFTEEVLKGDVKIEGGRIVGIGEYSGGEEVDCSGKYICPGFIDAHVHIESSMVSPLEFAKTILPWGTTTIIADPHEMVNVAGAKAVSYLLDAVKKVPVNVHVMLPSSVPSTAFETNGADFTAEDMKAFLEEPGVLGLGEVMCYPDVLAGKKAIMDKLALFQDRMIDGHAPGVLGKELQIYRNAGVQTDHECTNFLEALEKMRAGMKILIREGSGAKNLEVLVKGCLEHNLGLEEILFCTDDKHLEDIKRQGHIRWNVKKAVDLGMEPVKAIKIASLNAARAYGLQGSGAVAAGYRADLVVLDSLSEVTVSSVYKDGQLVDEAYLNRFTDAGDASVLRGTVHFEDVTPEKIAVRAGETNVVIENVPYQLLTLKSVEAVPSRDGFFRPDSVYSKLCVVERHRGTGNAAAAPVKGFGIRGGAIATTVAHDSHNVIAIGDNDEDLCIAINETKKTDGGYVVAAGGRVVGVLPLCLAGLMSSEGGETVIEKIGRLVDYVHGMGVPEYIDPFITLSFMALPVIPQVRLTDMGLFDVEKFELIP